ncbi:hypothetical protein [Stackebrandtia soli]|uniref:hypothetical protein n=1 Tax=Stackebrandtia soli TaxID=1892856 RepID=UPI0039ECF93C
MHSKLKLRGSPTTFSQVGGLSGIGFALVILLANHLIFVPAGLPNTGAGLGEVTAFFDAEADAVALGSAFIPAAWVLATVFGASAVAAARRSEHDRGEAWALIGFGGILLQNVNVAAVSAIRLALSRTGVDEGTAGLWALHDALFGLNGTFLALALVGLSVAGTRARLLRPWQAVLGYVAAALQFASATLTPWVVEYGGVFGLIGLSGWLIWVAWLILYGVALLRAAPEQPLGRPVVERSSRDRAHGKVR